VEGWGRSSLTPADMCTPGLVCHRAAPPADAGKPYSYQIAGDWARAAGYWRENGCRYQAALALADSHDGRALRQALDEL
jgi:hypothetical protein